jgi:uncharacterized protein involved in propanediol utilization
MDTELVVWTAAEQGVGRAPGSFGELLQGALNDVMEHFLVTLPIQCYSLAKFVPVEGWLDVEVVPSSKTKSLAFARRFIQLFGIKSGGRLFITSDLPEGKGLASSTADLVATGRALASHFQRPLSQDILLSLLRDLEPSDGIMYPTHTLFYHRQVRLGLILGDLPPLTILALDEGGVIDTIQYNQTLAPFSHAEKQEYRSCLDKMMRAFREQDLVTLGEVSTRSATLNQKRCPKRFYPAVLEICRKAQGLGVVVTHSGPCIGILLAQDDRNFHAKEAYIRDRFATLSPHLMVYETLTKHRPKRAA